MNVTVPVALLATDRTTAQAPDRLAQMLLRGPIAGTLLRLSWPNVLVMLVQASTGLIEAFWISRLGTPALAGMALVFPVVMLMQMMSQGAVGGGISSAIARALGGRRQAEADAYVLHALVLNIVISIALSIVVLAFGPALYRALGGEGDELNVALTYSNVVFSGLVLMWIANGLASIIRGTGNMLVPAMTICIGALALLPLSPCLIFGIGPVPALGVAGGGAALLLYYAGNVAFLGWYLLSGRNAARLRIAALRWPMFREILRVGAVAALTSLQTNLTVAITTSLVGHWFGPADVAGYGTAARLEYLLSPLVFGIGGTLVTMVGMNIGAGQRERALRVAFIGGAVAFAMTEAIGLAAFAWPEPWLRLFGAEPAALSAGSAYLRVVGPFYGMYGLGFALYFASQGAGRLLWPLLAGLSRLLIATIGGWLVLRSTGSQVWLYAALSVGLVVYGSTIAIAVLRGAWFASGAIEIEQMDGYSAKKGAPSQKASAHVAAEELPRSSF
jgi:putative MATE family efflux protein